jgi:hypothetical protein
MRCRTTRRFRLRFETLENRATPSATPLSIAGFLAAQGSADNFNTFNGVTLPGLPQESGWGTSSATFAAGTGHFARVDYTGQDAAFLHLNYGTTTSGSVSEHPLPGGGTEVTVNLHTHNAFAFATTQSDVLPFDSWPLIFGATPEQLLAGANPGLADSHLHVVYDRAPGAPQYFDIVDNVLSGPPAGITSVAVSFQATAEGTTPSGQPATLVINEAGPQGRTPIPNSVKDFGYTAEIIDVHVHGGPNSAPAAQPAAVASSSSAFSASQKSLGGVAATIAAPPDPPPSSHLGHRTLSDGTNPDDPLGLSVFAPNVV